MEEYTFTAEILWVTESVISNTLGVWQSTFFIERIINIFLKEKPIVKIT
jgi:hypothetical protein